MRQLVADIPGWGARPTLTETSISAHEVEGAMGCVIICVSSRWLVGCQSLIGHVSQNDHMINMSMGAAATRARSRDHRGVRDRRAARCSGGFGSVLSNDRGGQVEALRQRGRSSPGPRDSP